MRKLLWLVAAAAAAGCDRSTPPPVVYVLERSVRDTLPLTLRVDEDDCRHLLTGGEIAFAGTGEFRSRYDIERHCPGQPVASVPLGTHGLVTVRQDTAIFMDSLNAESGRGRITADSVTVEGPLHRLIYLRRFADRDR